MNPTKPLLGLVGRFTFRNGAAKAAVWRLTPVGATQVILLLLALALPGGLQAQLTFTTNNGTITITGYTGPGGDVTIPSTTNGLSVTTIGNSAFYSNTTSQA